MSYKLDELYGAIASSGRTLGRYTISSNREYGSGAVYFTSDSGRMRQVYASPHWEIDSFDTVIGGERQSRIALQVEEFDDKSGDYIGTDTTAGENDLPFTMLGDLGQDVEHYFKVMEGCLSTLP